MTEEVKVETTVTQANSAKPVKRGRKLKKSILPRKVAALGQSNLAEDHPKDVKKPASDAVNKGWFSGRACKIKIFQADGEGEEVVLKLGDSPFLRVRRGVELIVPWEIISVLDDSVVDIPRTRWFDGKPVGEYYERVTRFPYAFLGEVSWSEYTSFRDSERKKPMKAITTGMG